MIFSSAGSRRAQDLMVLYITYTECVIRRTERFVGPNNVSLAKDVYETNVEFLHIVDCEPTDEITRYETVTAPECVPGDTVYVPIIRYTGADGARVGCWCLATPQAFLKHNGAELALKCALDATYSRNVRPWEGMYERLESTDIIGIVVT
jgi:hypothetical protein